MCGYGGTVDTLPWGDYNCLNKICDCGGTVDTLPWGGSDFYIFCGHGGTVDTLPWGGNALRVWGFKSPCPHHFMELL